MRQARQARIKASVVCTCGLQIRDDAAVRPGYVSHEHLESLLTKRFCDTVTVSARGYSCSRCRCEEVEDSRSRRRCGGCEAVERFMGYLEGEQRTTRSFIDGTVTVFPLSFDRHGRGASAEWFYRLRDVARLGRIFFPSDMEQCVRARQDALLRATDRATAKRPTLPELTFLALEWKRLELTLDRLERFKKRKESHEQGADQGTDGGAAGR